MLQSIFSIQFMFALLSAGLCSPLQTEAVCDAAAFSTWRTDKVDLLFHGGLNTPGSQGASYVSINHSLACPPCRRCHARSVLRKAGHSEEIPVSVARSLPLHRMHEEANWGFARNVIYLGPVWWSHSSERSAAIKASKYGTWHVSVTSL